MKLGFLYAGQGSQKEGMGKEFYEDSERVRRLYEAYPEVKELSFFAEPEELSKTRNTQPCMLAFNVAVTDLLKEQGIVPEMAAGLSIGEYGALYCSGVLSEKEMLTIGKVRGRAMEEALEGKDTVMFACIGGSYESLREACEAHSTETARVEVANLNCPGQIVIGGDRERTETLVEALKEKKLVRKAVPLKVSGAFHTSYMEPASEVLRTLFSEMDFKEMKTPVVFNLTGREKTEDESIKELMIKQVKQTVHFEESIRHMAECGVDTFIEIGFGNVLAGFVKKIAPDCQVLPCFDRATLQEVAEYVKRNR